LGVWTLALFTVSGVPGSSIVIGSDPLTDVLAGVLTVPLRELYAVLWRIGVVEVVD
jgi:hypothetical protein